MIVGHQLVSELLQRFGLLFLRSQRFDEVLVLLDEGFGRVQRISQIFVVEESFLLRHPLVRLLRVWKNKRAKGKGCEDQLTISKQF